MGGHPARSRIVVPEVTVQPSKVNESTGQHALIFFAGVARHPRAVRNGIVCCCVQRAAYGLVTAHALLCIVNGDDSAVFRFFLSLVTLTFELGQDVCTLHLTAKFDHTGKQTNRRR